MLIFYVVSAPSWVETSLALFQIRTCCMHYKDCLLGYFAV